MKRGMRLSYRSRSSAREFRSRASEKRGFRSFQGTYSPGSLLRAKTITRFVGRQESRKFVGPRQARFLYLITRLTRSGGSLTTISVLKPSRRFERASESSSPRGRLRASVER